MPGLVEQALGRIMFNFIRNLFFLLILQVCVQRIYSYVALTIAGEQGGYGLLVRVLLVIPSGGKGLLLLLLLLLLVLLLLLLLLLVVVVVLLLLLTLLLLQ